MAPNLEEGFWGYVCRIPLGPSATRGCDSFFHVPYLLLGTLGYLRLRISDYKAS